MLKIRGLFFSITGIVKQKFIPNIFHSTCLSCQTAPYKGIRQEHTTLTEPLPMVYLATFMKYFV